MSERVPTAEEWAEFHEWERHIYLEWHPDLPVNDKGRPTMSRDLLLLVAHLIAWHGSAGKFCYPSDHSVGEITGHSRRTVARYRSYLIKHGKFKATGKRINNVQVLNWAISEPATAEDIGTHRRKQPARETVPAKEVVDANGHITVGRRSWDVCPACNAAGNAYAHPKEPYPL